jgi:predicted CXXCH cytochrome family protein
MDRGGLALGAVLALVVGASAIAMRPPKRADAAPGLPHASVPSEWVSSAACRACHPSEHASWHRTFHRTMTQVATPSTVLAPFERRDGEVWIPEGRIVMTTGSHHEQAYWIRGSAGELRLAPMVWLREEKKLIRREDAFLRPPDAPMPSARWNSNCIQCHATGGRPKQSGEKFDTEAVELGIACEACHGPGGAHVAKHRDPIERWMSRGKRDPSIVNPAKLDAEHAAAVCGQCHAYAYPRDEEDWWTNGYAVSFRSGQLLDSSRTLLTLDVLRSADAPTLEAHDESLYWPDGTIRVGGREYNGLVKSPCFEKGSGERKLTCVSCHSMHASDPDDQIAHGKRGDAMCTGCHSSQATRAHTHHAEGSSGSRCVECHMPMTSYALFTAMRSHRIESPRIHERLSACNLCHLDRTLAWTDQKLHDWYGQPLANPAGDLPAIAVWALRGDAAERVLAAAAMGRTEALDASGSDWERPVLEALRADPYAAVRFVAERSLRSVTTGRVLVDDDTIRTELTRRNERAVTIAE